VSARGVLNQVENNANQYDLFFRYKTRTVIDAMVSKALQEAEDDRSSFIPRRTLLNAADLAKPFLINVTEGVAQVVDLYVKRARSIDPKNSWQRRMELGKAFHVRSNFDVDIPDIYSL